jgi:hypothetical protein
MYMSKRGVSLHGFLDCKRFVSASLSFAVLAHGKQTDSHPLQKRHGIDREVA